MNLAQVLAHIPFNAHLGLEVLSLEAGQSVVRLEDRPEQRNHVGGPHAGALFTVAEAASGGAVLSAIGERLGAVTPLAKGGEIKYRKLARGPVVAKAKLAEPASDALERLARDGKADLDVHVAIHDQDDVVVAEASFRWALR